MSEIDPELLHEAMCFVYAQPDGVAVSSVEGGEIVALAIHQDRQRRGWQPIETAPKDGRTILAFNKVFGIYSTAFTTQWVDGDTKYRGFPCGFHSGAFGAWDCQPTEWMPLPAPPKAE